MKNMCFLIVLCLGLLVFGNSAKAETYYFDNSVTGWSYVSVWSWSLDDDTWMMENNITSWPGIELSKDSATGYYVWETCGELPEDGAIMFNDGGGGFYANDQICDASAYAAAGAAGKVFVPTERNTVEDEEKDPMRKAGMWYGEWKPVEDNGFAKKELRLTKCTEDSVTLEWDAGGADGYIIQQNINGTWTTICTFIGGSFSDHTVSGLNPATEYQFRLAQYKYIGETEQYGEYTDVLTVITEEALSNVCDFREISSTETTITLGWSKHDKADGYVVEWFNDSKDKWEVYKTIEDSEIISCKITGLKPITDYGFVIRAYRDRGGERIYSNDSWTGGGTTFPVMTGLTYTARTASAITLKWNKNTAGEGYVIEQYKSGKWTPIKTIEGNTTVSYKVTGLKSSTSYKFRVKAYVNWAAMEDPIFSGASTKTIKTLPSTVKSFTFSGRTANSVTLGWTKNTSATGYEITMYKNGGWKTVATIKNNSTVSYKVTGLGAGVNYKFKIRGYKLSGTEKLYGDYSTVVVTTRPAYIKGFKYSSRTSNSVTLGWTKNGSVTGYEITMYKDGGWKTVATITNKAIVSYKVTGLGAGVNYKFKIRGYKQLGTAKLYGDYATLTVTTCPSYIKGFKCNKRTSNSVTLGWTKNGSVTGYEIMMYKNGSWKTVATITNKATVTYRVSGLVSRASYKFRIRGYKQLGTAKLYGDYVTKTVTTL